MRVAPWVSSWVSISFGIPWYVAAQSVLPQPNTVYRSPLQASGDVAGSCSHSQKLIALSGGWPL